MKRFTLLALGFIVLLGGCVQPDSLKAPCAGASGSPCSRTPLPNEPMELHA